ncbi:EcsC family protein [Streptomyces antimicrobicus]|uniref:EcsC family protein n=1 Tax=Streptomyces antimicrobicus TaxID=2883108 RepID=A0ABS8B591_9ACTN|nr:EcsC family protein [Streptomyces antimicrobicus]MCB5179751.1 EcsC family protein [Streptomyces antimicrobicus]
MTGSTPFRKRRFGRPDADTDTTGPETGPGAAGTPAVPSDAAAPLPSTTGVDEGHTGASRARRLDRIRSGVRKSRDGARAAVLHVADRIIENAPRVPVRDLATLRAQFPGLGPDQLADKLIAGAANGTSTVGAGIGAAAMLPVPPAMPAELAAEIVGVAAIELKLVAELHEVYGLRPPGNLKERSVAYLSAWTEERGVDLTKPTTLNAALGGQMKRELRQQIMKRMFRNLPNLMPFMVGAAVGAVMNRRDTKKLAHKIRADLRGRAVPWDQLPALPPLAGHPDPLPLPGAVLKALEGRD